MAVATLALLGVIGYLSYETKSQVALDKQMCPVTGPLGQNIFLVDTTDPISPTTLMDARNRLRAEVDKVKVGERIEIYGLSEKIGGLEEMYAGCKPDDGSDASFIMRNPKLMKRDWEETFRKPLEEAEGKIGQGQGGNQSPIMAAIQNIKLRVFDQYKDRQIRKKLIVLSDMIEHTQHFSQYRSGTDFPAFKKSDAHHQFRTDLEGVAVEIWFIDRGIQQFRDKAHMEFWLNWVHDNKGDWKPPVRLEGVNPQGS